MKKIFKYQYTAGEKWSIPSCYKIRHVAMQNGSVCLWAEIDEMNQVLVIEPIIVGTGHLVPSCSEYAGTTQDGEYVWHLYLREL